MYKIKTSFIFSPLFFKAFVTVFTTVFTPAFAQYDDILSKLQKLEYSEELRDIKIPERRFDQEDYTYKTNPFRAVILKNSYVQSLDGKNIFHLKENTTLLFREIEAGGAFTFIIGTDGNPEFVCYSKDVKKIEHVVSMRPKHISFEKEKILYNKINVDQVILASANFGRGSHAFNISENNTQSSNHFGLDLSFKEDMIIPFILSLNFNQLAGENISWQFLNLGMKLFYDLSSNNDRSWLFYLNAQRSIYGSANFYEYSINLLESRYGIGSTYKLSKWLFSIDIFQEKLFIPAEVDLSKYSIPKAEYTSGFLLSVGYEMEFTL